MHRNNPLLPFRITSLSSCFTFGFRNKMPIVKKNTMIPNMVKSYIASTMLLGTAFSKIPVKASTADTGSSVLSSSTSISENRSPGRTIQAHMVPWQAAIVEVNKYTGTARAPIAPISSTRLGKMIIINTIKGSTNSFNPLTQRLPGNAIISLQSSLSSTSAKLNAIPIP